MENYSGDAAFFGGDTDWESPQPGCNGSPPNGFFGGDCDGDIPLTSPLEYSGEYLDTHDEIQRSKQTKQNRAIL